MMKTLLKFIAPICMSMPALAEPMLEKMPGTFNCSQKTGAALESCKTDNMVICMKHGLNETECAGMLDQEGNIIIRVENP
jgi:hypothetical protein